MPAVTFSAPLYLLLLPLAAAWSVWVLRRSLAGLPPGRVRAVLAARMVLVALLVLALAGPSVRFPTRDLRVLFLLDRSASISPEQQARQIELVNEANRRLPAHAASGVLVFGRTAQLEREPARDYRVRSIHSQLDPDGTDLAAAVRLGASMLPPETARRLVILSDGDQTAGDALPEAAMAGASGIQVDVVPIAPPRRPDARLESLDAPERARPREPLSLRVLARSTLAGPAKIRLLRDGIQVAERPWALRPGANVLDLPQTLAQPGLHTWEAVLEAAGDAVPENNRALAFTHLRGRARVLLVEGRPGEAAPLEQALRDRSFAVERRSVAALPATQAETAAFEGIVLVNVRADQVSPAQMRMLETGVRSAGTGLIMVGGRESLTAGGWRGTPVEEALPVRMEVERRRNQPSLALVLVIDQSASMSGALGGGEKLQFAKEAAQAAAEGLRPDDELGVVAFSDVARWAVPLAPLGARERAVEGIWSIGAGGGTNMFPALQEAFSALNGSRAALKHVLLLTDGQSQGGDFEGIVRSMAARRITLTAVGVGSDAAGPLLRRLAKLGKGRYYDANRASALPAIFNREAQLAARSAVVEEPFRPRATEGSALLQGLPAPPPLLGYVATTAKQSGGVDVSLSSPRGEPVLASWRYGLGKSVVVTTDAGAGWAAPWRGGYYRAFWAQVVRSALRPEDDGGLRVQVSLADGAGRVSIDAASRTGELLNSLPLEASLAGPEGGRRLRVEQTAPGRYEGTFAAPARGQYLVTVRNPASESGPGSIAIAGAAIPYSPELRGGGSGTALLLGLAERTGGRAWPALGAGLHPEMLRDFFRPGPPARTAPLELWSYFALAGALLLPLDIGLRRLVVPPREWSAAFVGLVRRRTAPSGAREERLSRLLSARRRAAVPEAQPPPGPLLPAASPTAAPATDPEPPAPAETGATTGRLLAAKRRAARPEE